MDSRKDIEKDHINPDISTESFGNRTLYKGIRSKFPLAQQMSTDTLQLLLEQVKTSSTMKLVLIDIRELEERKVSHIPNSIHFLPSEKDFSSIFQRLDDFGNTIKLVAYCSVGYRSSLFAQKFQRKLAEDGKTNVEVYNLEGSIFKWANENRDLIDDTGNSIIYVHPYNAVWGKFLNAEKRKYSNL